MAAMNDQSVDGSVTEVIDFDLNSALHDNVVNADTQDTGSLGQNPDGITEERSSGNPAVTEGPILDISDQNAPNECPALGVGSPDDNGSSSESSNISGSRELVSEPRLSLGLPPNNAAHSVLTSGNSRQQNGGSKDTNAALSGKEKEVQIPEAGSSSNPRQVDSNLLDSHSVYSNAQGLLPPPYHMNSLQHPLRNIAGLHGNPDLFPHLSTNVYHGGPQGQGWYNPRMHLGGQQNPMLFNAFETTNAPLHYEFYPHQSSQPMWFTEASMGFRSPNMSQMMLGPGMWRNVPQFPLTVNSNVRTDVPAERGQAPGLRNLSHQPRPPSPAIGNVGAFGGPFAHPDLHQWPVPPRAYEPNHAAPNLQMVQDYPPWSLFPQGGAGPDAQAQYMDLAPCMPHPGYGYYSDTMPVPGPGNQSHNPYPPEPSISPSSNRPRRSGVPINTEDWIIPELLEIWHADRGNASQRLQAETTSVRADSSAQNWFRNAVALLSRDRYRGLRLDIESMPYEDLIALQELLGMVSTGLKEETIMELLKRRSYESSVSDPSEEPETCCICREEYVGGEDIGTLNCHHEFHTDCIKQWLVLKNQCPICKMEGLGS